MWYLYIRTNRSKKHGMPTTPGTTPPPTNGATWWPQTRTTTTNERTRDGTGAPLARSTAAAVETTTTWKSSRATRTPTRTPTSPTATAVPQAATARTHDTGSEPPCPVSSSKPEPQSHRAKMASVQNCIHLPLHFRFVRVSWATKQKLFNPSWTFSIWLKPAFPSAYTRFIVSAWEKGTFRHETLQWLCFHMLICLLIFCFLSIVLQRAGFTSTKQPFNFKTNDWLVLKSKYSVKLAMAENQRVVKGVYRIPENWTRSSVSLYVIIASMLPDRMLPLSLVHNLSRHRMMLWSLPISRPPRKWLTNWNISITQHKPTASCLFLQKWNLKYHDLGVFQSLEILGGGIST